MKKQISYFGDRLVKEDWSYSVYSIYTVIALNKLLSFNLRRAASTEAKPLNMMNCISLKMFL